MGLPLSEQETTISFSRDGNDVQIWTSDRTIMTKLDKLVKNSTHYKLIEEGVVDGDVVVKRYCLDNKRLVSFRSNIASKQLSDKQKEAFRKRMEKCRNDHG